MTPGLVGAVAADRERRRMRERREQVQDPDLLGGRHLPAVPLHEGGPLAPSPRSPGERDQPGARRELGKPEVVPVPRGVLALRDAAGWVPHGPEAEAFARDPWRPE